MGDWSPGKSDSKKPVTEGDKKKESGTVATKKQKPSPEVKADELSSPAVLGKFDLEMNVFAAGNTPSLSARLKKS